MGNGTELVLPHAFHHPSFSVLWHCYLSVSPAHQLQVVNYTSSHFTTFGFFFFKVLNFNQFLRPSLPTFYSMGYLFLISKIICNFESFVSCKVLFFPVLWPLPFICLKYLVILSSYLGVQHFKSCLDVVCGAEGWGGQGLVNHGVHCQAVRLSHFIEEPLDVFLLYFELIRFSREVFFFFFLSSILLPGG